MLGLAQSAVQSTPLVGGVSEFTNQETVNPGANAVLFDTGPIATPGNYAIVLYLMSSAAIGAGVQIQHRDAANAVTKVINFVFPGMGALGIFGIGLYVPILANERIRVITTGALTTTMEIAATQAKIG